MSIQSRTFRGKGTKKRPIARNVGIVLIFVIFIAPILWMLLASFKSNVDIHDSSKAFFFQPTLENYGTVFNQAEYGKYIWNSFFVATLATLFSLVLAVPAAYSMSRFTMNRSAMRSE